MTRMVTAKTKQKTEIFRNAALASLAAAAAFFAAQQVTAGPITSPGGYPFTKLAVYQGVIAIVPGLSGDSVMEIGNAGRDIAGSSDLVLRPGTSNSLFVRADSNGGSNRATQLIIQGYANQNLKLNIGIHTEASPAYADIGVVEESVVWRNLILAKNGGNIGIGDVTNPAGKLVVNNNAAGTGSAGDAVAAYANSSNSAILGQQNNSGGYAGYFTNGTSGSNTKPTLYAENLYQSGVKTYVDANAALLVGDLEIQQKGEAGVVPTWPNGSILKIIGDNSLTNPSPDDGYLLDVRNANATGAAARFQGQSLFVGYDDTMAVSAYAGNTSASTKNSYGLYVLAGTGPGANYGGYFKSLGTNNFAAYFKGRVQIQGNTGTPTTSLNMASVTTITSGTCSTACANAGLTCAMAYQTAGGVAGCGTAIGVTLTCICY